MSTYRKLTHCQFFIWNLAPLNDWSKEVNTKKNSLNSIVILYYFTQMTTAQFELFIQLNISVEEFNWLTVHRSYTIDSDLFDIKRELSIDNSIFLNMINILHRSYSVNKYRSSHLVPSYRLPWSLISVYLYIYTYIS